MAGVKTIEVAMARPMDCVKMCKMIYKSKSPSTTLDHEPIESNLVDWVTQIISTGFAVNATIAGRLIGTAGFSFNRYPHNKLKTFYNQEWTCVLPDYGGFGLEKRMVDRVMRIALKNRADVLLPHGEPELHFDPKDFKPLGVLYKYTYGIDGVPNAGIGNQRGASDGCGGIYQPGEILAEGSGNTLPTYQ